MNQEDSEDDQVMVQNTAETEFVGARDERRDLEQEERENADGDDDGDEEYEDEATPPAAKSDDGFEDVSFRKPGDIIGFEHRQESTERVTLRDGIVASTSNANCQPQDYVGACNRLGVTSQEYPRLPNMRSGLHLKTFRPPPLLLLSGASLRHSRDQFLFFQFLQLSSENSSQSVEEVTCVTLTFPSHLPTLLR